MYENQGLDGGRKVYDEDIRVKIALGLSHTCLAVTEIGNPEVMPGGVGECQDHSTPLQTSGHSRQVPRPRCTILEKMSDLRAGHALQTSRATREHAGKVGRDGMIKPGDAVGKKAGDGCGEPMPPERTEERLERLLDHGGKRPSRVLHGGVSRMPCA